MPALSSVENVELETDKRHFHKEMYFLLTINIRKTRFWVIAQEIALLQLRVVEVRSIEDFFCAGSVVDTLALLHATSRLGPAHSPHRVQIQRMWCRWRRCSTAAAGGWSPLRAGLS